MKKHSSLLEAEKFEDGTTPAISLNPVLCVCNFFKLFFGRAFLCLVTTEANQKL